MKKKIDGMDLKIISVLEQNGRISNTELAKMLKTSETTIRNRIKRLIDNELIKIVAIRNRARLGYDLSGNIRLKADTKKIQSIGSSLSKMDHIWYVAQLAGYDEFDVEFSVASQHELLILLDEINKIDGVIRTKTSLRLQLIKHLGEYMAVFPDAKNANMIKL